MNRGLRLFFRHRLAIVGATLLAVQVVVALLAPVIAPQDPYRQDIASRLRSPGYLSPGRGVHYLGTDQVGRDVLSRIIYGSRISLLIAFTSIPIAAAVGIVIGAFAGYVGGVMDSLLMRFVDLQMAFPFILLALVIISLLGPSLSNLIILFVVTGWAFHARTVRGSVLALKETTLIESARAIGLRDWQILFRHLVPNCLGKLPLSADHEMMDSSVANREESPCERPDSRRVRSSRS